MKQLSVKAENIVFALVRNKARATDLQDFVGSEENKHKNVVVLEADLDDYRTLKVCASLAIVLRFDGNLSCISGGGKRSLGCCSRKARRSSTVSFLLNPSGDLHAQEAATTAGHSSPVPFPQGILTVYIR